MADKPVVIHSDIPAEFRDLALAKAKEAISSTKVTSVDDVNASSVFLHSVCFNVDS